MASRTPFDKQIISILKYDVSRPYLGAFTFSDLYNAQRNMRRSEYYDANGSRDMRVYVGKINGDVICGALWRLMEYNPVRFCSNPFWYDGKMSIYRFVADITLPADTVTANVIAKLRGKLREYLSANAAPNGRWRDEIETNNGFVYTVLNDGRAGPMYKKLCLLRDAVKIVTAQNCADYNLKSKPYREYIIKAVERFHPGTVVQKTQPAPVSAPVKSVNTYNNVDNTVYIDVIYDKMEHLQITLDNRDSITPELYEQTSDEMDRLLQELYYYQGHTL